jgi:type I restriction enzyme S subunit
MTATPPSLANLKSNPDWASLPLFDRTGWKRVRFGDVVENCAETCDPTEAGLERVVAMEHLEPGSLHVRSWGNVADGTTFTRRCRPGQVLFGKRRAYQRKVAVAEFEAVVSGDIYVLAPKDTRRLRPELLPFLCLSERFFQHAVGTSAGSLSPRTNWSSLASFEFALPPLDQQRRIAEILWAVDEVIEEYLSGLDACDNWNTAFVEERCLSEKFPRVRLEKAVSGIIAGKSVIGVNEPAGDGEFGVLKVSAVGPKGFDAAEHKRLIDQKDFLPRFAVTQGDFLITRCNTKELVGRVCIVPEDHPSLMLCDKTIKLEFDEDKASPGFMDAVLRSRRLRTQIEACATGTGGAMKNISQDNIRSFFVPLPPLRKQLDLLEKIERGNALKASLESATQRAAALQASITNSTFS